MMAIKLSELAKMTDEQIRNLSPGTKCVACGCRIQRTITGEQQTSDGPVCDDCYYKQLGEVIDKHPLGLPRGGRR
jgi:hypothetical protein